MRTGPREFSWFIFRVTNPTMREFFMSPQNPLRVKEALISLLAGDIYGKTPIWRSIRILKALYYLVSIGNLAPHRARLAAPARQHPRRRGPGIVRRRAGLRRGRSRRSLCSALLCGRVARARRRTADARAGGRRTGDAGCRRTSAGTEPLWELGVGVAGFRFDDYRGSDHTNTYLLPLPFFAYRGPILRADRDGARAVLFEGRRVTVDVSLGASVPTKSKDDAARRGMPDLAGTFEIGPNLVVELWQSSDRKLKLELRMPVREAITLERSPRAIGLTFSPNLNLDIGGLPGKGNLGLLAGPLFARPAATTSTSTASPRSSRPRPGPPTMRPGGYAGWRATAAFSRRFGNAWLGAFVRYDNLHGAAFAPSPLVRKETTRHCGLRHLMDLRDFEPARTDRRLSGEAGLAAGACVTASCFAAVIVQLGVMSLVWNLIAPLLALAAAARTPARGSAARRCRSSIAAAGRAPSGSA